MRGNRARKLVRRFANTGAWLACLMAAVDAPFTSSAMAQADLPRFERGECLIPQPPGARLDCGYVITAESREQPNGRNVRLAVAVFRAQPSSANPPIVMLHGGPGANGLRSLLPQMAAEWAVAFDRDVVVYDQRGSGLSEPPLCPEVVQGSRGRPLEELADECLASLRREGVDSFAYNTDHNATDAVEVRRALGYGSWFVYGMSYGSRLALEVARRDEDAVRGLVLTSPLPPGPAFYAEFGVNFRRALERVFERCADQPACGNAFPTLESDFYGVYDELNAQPMTLELDSATIVRVDGVRFVQGIRRQFLDDRPVRVPLLINELRRGDRERAARSLVNLGGLNPVNALTVTQDVCGPALDSAVASARADLREAFRFVTMGDCALWPTRSPASVRPSSPSAPNDVPTLIFASEFDDRTPVEYGRRIAADLRSSHVYEIPGHAHGWLLGDCEDAIVAQFLADASGPLDASCISREDGITFETRGLDQQRLVFRVSDTNASGGIAGTWEAWVAGLPTVTTIELRIDGNSVVGTVTQPRNTVPISDGRFERGTLLLSATAATGDRAISLRGTVSENEIHFVRDFTVRPGGDPGGEGFFGIRGPQTFIARRLN